jgi:hypothetical protein
MRAKLLTLRFSSCLGRFDDAPLVALQQKVVFEHLREHVVSVAGESAAAAPRLQTAWVQCQISREM